MYLNVAQHIRTDKMETSTKEINQENAMEMSQDNEITKKQIEELYEKARKLKKFLPKQYKRQPLPQAISDEEFNLILKKVSDKKNFKESKIAFLLAYEAGLRISEIKHLQKEDIDLKSKRIFIRLGKFSKDRVVPLPKTWKTYMMDFIPIKKSVRSLERNFKNAVKIAGVNSIYHFHSLRHSFATHCLERGMPINQVQLLMGHSSVGTTNVYIRANPQDALASYEKVF
jgi:integrase/recombinase XerD